VDAFIARQPIFDAHRIVQAYELLFRSGLENAYSGADPDRASAKVITGSAFLPRLDAVSGGKRVFVNVTRDVLVQGFSALLPPATTTIEILETIRPDPEVIDACRRLKMMGFRLALDDFRPDPAWRALLDLADIVKVDVLASNAAERASLARSLRPRGITLLAEKVETREIFRETAGLGYSLFQGYFFARPVIVSGRDIPASRRSHLEILREIHRPDLDYGAICSVVEREVALSYKLLRYVNSAIFGWRGAISSIRHALLLMGITEIRRWASVIALAGMASDEPGELIATALLRGRFCELLASGTELAQRESDLFLVGLFSVIDAILGCPLGEILENIPIAADAKGALLGEPGPMNDLLQLVISYTMGDWTQVEERAERLHIDQAILPDAYAWAIEWAQGSGGVSSTARAA
jgi:EAL and modified HD-GYP domain-containing signal transduction protein